MPEDERFPRSTALMRNAIEEVVSYLPAEDRNSISTVLMAWFPWLDTDVDPANPVEVIAELRRLSRAVSPP